MYINSAEAYYQAMPLQSTPLTLNDLGEEADVLVAGVDGRPHLAVLHHPDLDARRRARLQRHVTLVLDLVDLEVTRNVLATFTLLQP